MNMTGWRAEDFDHEGCLRAPRVFWLAVGFVMKAWWLLGLAQAADQHDGSLLALLYPQLPDVITGLATGLAGWLVVVLYPLRSRFPRSARVSYLLLLCAGAVSVGYAGAQWVRETDDGQSMLWGGLLCAELACMVVLLPDRRLRQVFGLQASPARAGGNDVRG